MTTVVWMGWLPPPAAPGSSLLGKRNSDSGRLLVVSATVEALFLGAHRVLRGLGEGPENRLMREIDRCYVLVESSRHHEAIFNA